MACTLLCCMLSAATLRVAAPIDTCNSATPRPLDNLLREHVDRIPDRVRAEMVLTRRLQRHSMKRLVLDHDR